MAGDIDEVTAPDLAVADRTRDWIVGGKPVFFHFVVKRGTVPIGSYGCSGR